MNVITSLESLEFLCFLWWQVVVWLHNTPHFDLAKQGPNSLLGLAFVFYFLVVW